MEENNFDYQYGYSCLIWLIDNPFVPWTGLEVEFFDNTRFPLLWRARIDPAAERRMINYWKFIFSLECVDLPREREVRDVFVHIHYNNDCVKEVKERNVDFAVNSARYSLETIIQAEPVCGNDRLIISVLLLLPAQVQENLQHTQDAKRLSDDLENIFKNPPYPNMKLMAMDDDEAWNVHSYIILTRWNNFEKVHKFKLPLTEPIKINASDLVLKDILVYLYSGKLIKSCHNESYVQELNGLINAYNLRHLYIALSKPMRHKKIITKRPCLHTQYIFPYYEPIGGRCIEKKFSNGYFTFRFKYEVRDYPRIGPHFVYTLTSLNKFTVYVQVNAKLKRETNGNGDPDTTGPWWLHQRDYTLEHGESRESEKIFNVARHFPNPDNLNASDFRRRVVEGDEFFIECTFKVTKGTPIDEVISATGEIQTDEERYSILCEHLQKLKIDGYPEADLKISASAVGHIYSTYKGIFVVRVPNWQAVIELPDIVGQHQQLPDRVRLFLANEAIPYVLSYICTGRTDKIPDHLLNAVKHFARRSNFTALENYVDRAGVASAIL